RGGFGDGGEGEGGEVVVAGLDLDRLFRVRRVVPAQEQIDLVFFTAVGTGVGFPGPVQDHLIAALRGAVAVAEGGQREGAVRPRHAVRVGGYLRHHGRAGRHQEDVDALGGPAVVDHLPADWVG